MSFPTHVRFAHPDAGWPAEVERAAKHLTPGEVYTICTVNVLQSQTVLFFRETGADEGFGAQMFEPFDPDAPAADDRLHAAAQRTDADAGSDIWKMAGRDDEAGRLARRELLSAAIEATQPAVAPPTVGLEVLGDEPDPDDPRQWYLLWRAENGAAGWEGPFSSPYEAAGRRQMLLHSQTTLILPREPYAVAEGRFTALRSSDPVKRDLELTCHACREVVCDIEAGDDLDVLVAVAREHRCGQQPADQPEQERTYTRDEVSRAVNDGAELVLDDDQLQVGDRERDLINLVVNAAMSRLDQPEVELDAVMDENYDGGSDEVRSWWSGWL